MHDNTTKKSIEFDQTKIIPIIKESNVEKFIIHSKSTKTEELN